VNIHPPNLQYYGDRKKAESLKGVALQFYSFCCVGIGESACLNRTKKMNDGSTIQAIITRDPYGNLNGVVRIAVNPVGPDEPLFLFCTSFNSTDSGTQVYKKPYPPITQGALIDAGDNPDYLVLPTPDFKVRNNYWVDSQEKNAISWGYAEVVISGTHYKYGKLAIQGIETSTDDWGLYYEPMMCALISDTQLVVIYIDKVNYAGSGTTRYCAVYDYTLDFTNQKITVTESSSFDLTAAGYGTGIIGTITESGDDYNYNRVLLGFLGDAKTVIYLEYYDNQTFLGTDFQQIKAFKLSDDYLTVLSGDTLIYDPTYHRWDTTSTSGSSGGVSWSRDISNYEAIVNLVEIRGDKIAFLRETDNSDSYTESQYTPIVDGDYFPTQTLNLVRNYDLYKWDYANGL